MSDGRAVDERMNNRGNDSIEGRQEVVATAVSDVEEFRLIRLLGRGGMGAVYLAHDSILDRQVALKLVRVGTTAEHRMRFLTEARAIARLSHPNVVTIFRAGTTVAGVPFLVQELIHGQSLDQLTCPVEPRRCLELALGIARGLAAAHRRGVLHRDIKPSNVMVDQQGTPRLLDFGVAKLFGESWDERLQAQGPSETSAMTVPWHPAVAALAATAAAAAHRVLAAPSALAATAEWPTAECPQTAPPVRDRAGVHTQDGAVLGTPLYLAPEQWRGQPATASSDLYSFGVLLYELLTGHPPFSSSDRDSLRAAVIGGAELPSLQLAISIARSQSNGHPAMAPAMASTPLELELIALVTSCLARDPSERPASADELLFGLERISADAPPIPTGNPYRGLASFESAQRGLFFGRGADAAAVIDRLRSESLVVLTGDSGVGKSSLGRAAVLPAIGNGALADGRRWEAKVVTLGHRGPRSLCDALGIAALDEDLSSVSSLTSLLSKHLALGSERGILLFIDQFEEIVTQCSAAQRSATAELVEALGDGIPGVKVLLSVRGDFFTRVAALPSLRTAMTRSLYVVRELAASDVRDAVVAPARAKGVRFESEAMVEVLVGSVVGAPRAGGLPLLQFALAELWERRDLARSLITQAALDELGGVAGALAGHADRVLTQLDLGARRTVRRLVLALVTEDGTRASRSRDELVGDDDPAAVAALEALIAGRLVAARDTGNGPPVYELVHESLLSAWTTLRGWLDEAAGQRGIRRRLDQAAAQWRRHGHRSDLLWGRALLSDTTRLSGLSEDARGFLRASRRAARRKLVASLALAAAIPAAVIATWVAFGLRDRERRSARVEQYLRAADAIAARAGTLAVSAAKARDEAWALFASNLWSAGEQRWKQRQALLAAARNGLRDAAFELERAMVSDASRADVRHRMAEVLYRNAQLAEEARDAVAVKELEQRFATYDSEYLARWRQPAVVTVTAPGAAQIEILEYRDQDAALHLQPVQRAEAGDRRELQLAPGSYLARCTLLASTATVIAFPFVVPRVAALAISIGLPARSAPIPDRFSYVAAGVFLAGSKDDDFFRQTFLSAMPMHPVSTGAYWISRYEVTYADYLEFLQAMPPARRETYRPPGLKPQGDDRFRLVLQPTSEIYAADQGEPIVYPGRTQRSILRWEDAPVSKVSFEDARGYAAWLASSGKVPRARLCTEMEWERAARGADGRSYSHGERLLPEDANFDRTYGQDPRGFGPDAVGSHPASDSPFGVSDMVGNAYEWVQGAGGGVLRGGSWYQGAATALAANREPSDATIRSERIGFRVCADP
jgi:eukaryotic-like serine/threonine-protein kinase